MQHRRDDSVSGAAPAAWDDYLHNRDNPAGETRDLWYHEAGCGQWLLVTRDTVSHDIRKVELVATLKGGAK